MTDITTIEQESKDLDLHVQLCAQRYAFLESRLESLHVRVDAIAKEIADNKKSLATIIITSATTIVASLMGVIVTILMKF
jgi:predicted  nucleic acid-binding Zn-ribbon protein